MRYFEITKREVLTSISIIAFFIIIGILISSKVKQNNLEKNEEYYKAIKLTNPEEFEYCMETNVGNGLIYGKLTGVEPVTYDEISGEYIYVKKVMQRYTMHTRVVTYSDGNGNTHTRTETYWTWDTISTDSKKVKEVYFLDHLFSVNKIDLPSVDYIDTKYKWGDIRYVYYGVDSECMGTLFTYMGNNTISDNSKFYEGRNIDETLNYIEKKGKIIVRVFWIIWMILCALSVYGFYYLDNKWLE